MNSPKAFLIIIISGLILAIGIIFYQQFFSKESSPLPKKTVLFLCVHNSFRSQIAEAYFNNFTTEKNINWQATKESKLPTWQAKSAGFLKADKINEKAVILMAEEGIDISDKKPKLMTDEMIAEAEKIVVVCKECEEQGLCLALPKDKEIDYWRLENPADLDLEKGREIRNLIQERILNLIGTLK